MRNSEEAQTAQDAAAAVVAAANALKNLMTCTALSRKYMRKCVTFKIVRRLKILASALSRETLPIIKSASMN